MAPSPSGAAPVTRPGRETLVGLALLLLCAALALWQASSWEIDNRVASWMGPGAQRTHFEAFVESFGGDETLIVACFLGPAPDPAELDWLDRLGPRLAALPAVDACLDPLHLPLAGSGKPQERLDAARSRPVVAALGAVSAGRVDWILALRAEATPRERAALVADWGVLLAESRAAGIDLVAAGHPLLAAALDREAARVDQVFAPWLVVAALLVASLFLRSLLLGLFSVLPAVVASAAIRALLAAVGWSSNLILVSIGPLVLVLVLASLLHLVARWKRLVSAGASAREAAQQARREVLPAALFAGGSTALGFGVFALSDIEAVQRLGLAVGGCVLLSIPLAYAWVSWSLRGMPVRPVDRAAGSTRTHGPWRRWARAARRQRLPVVGLSLTLCVLGSLAAFDLDFGTDALDYFPAGHAVRADFSRLEQDGAALSTMEVLVVGLSEDPRDWESVGSGLRALEDIEGIFGPEHVAADMRQSLGMAPMPLLGMALEQAGRRAGSFDGAHEDGVDAQTDAQTDARVDASRRWAYRWTLRFGTAGDEFVGPLRERVELYLTGLDASLGTQSVITGSLLGALGMQHRLMRTLAVSLGLTLLVTALLFVLVIRKLAELPVVLAVNLLPVCCVFSAAWLLNYSFDASTVMVAAIVLGLVVDNTFHLLHAAGTGARRLDLRCRLRAFDKVGEAAFVSSVTLMVGFSTLALSGFSPTAHFGVLVAIGIGVGLLADFVLLPALWLTPRWKQQPLQDVP